MTFGQIRQARRRFRSNPAGLDPEADIRQVLDPDDHDLPDGFQLESTWAFIGQGYLDLDQAAAATGARLDQPLFPVLGGFRDPANVRRELREARGTEALVWITSHSFRKKAATILDEAALSARLVADQLGHGRPSMTQDVYLGRRAVDSQAARALEVALRGMTSNTEKGGKGVGKEEGQAS